jgi:hypothetical protein
MCWLCSCFTENRLSWSWWRTPSRGGSVTLCFQFGTFCLELLNTFISLKRVSRSLKRPKPSSAILMKFWGTLNQGRLDLTLKLFSSPLWICQGLTIVSLKMKSRLQLVTCHEKKLWDRWFHRTVLPNSVARHQRWYHEWLSLLILEAST